MSDPKSLLDMCLHIVCCKLKEGRDLETLPLPLTVKKRARSVIKDIWFDTYYYMQWGNEYIYEYESLGHITNIHIVYEEYTCWLNDGRRFGICEECFDYLNKLTKTQALYRFGEYNNDNWEFYHRLTHERVRMNSDHDIENIVKKKQNYCDICLITPLFGFFNRRECMSKYEFHDRRCSMVFETYTCSCSESDSDDYGVDGHINITRLK